VGRWFESNRRHQVKQSKISGEGDLCAEPGVPNAGGFPALGWESPAASAGVSLVGEARWRFGAKRLEKKSDPTRAAFFNKQGVSNRALTGTGTSLPDFETVLDAQAARMSFGNLLGCILSVPAGHGSRQLNILLGYLNVDVSAGESRLFLQSRLNFVLQISFVGCRHLALVSCGLLLLCLRWRRRILLRLPVLGHILRQSESAEQHHQPSCAIEKSRHFLTSNRD